MCRLPITSESVRCSATTIGCLAEHILRPTISALEWVWHTPSVSRKTFGLRFLQTEPSRIPLLTLRGLIRSGKTAASQKNPNSEVNSELQICNPKILEFCPKSANLRVHQGIQHGF